jgi:hypothetical protein
MRIELKCPNGHKDYARDDRIFRSREEILNFWTKTEIHCKECDELYSEVHEILETVIIGGFPHGQ